jgi:uncharacterized membrane protein YkvA (DUF1232 family)
MTSSRLPLLTRWKQAARQLQLETYALYLAYRDRRVSWPARIFAALVVGYAFSPIDLIPDFIPVLGYLDDLVIIPLGIILARRMIPVEVMAESRAKASAALAQDKPVNRVVVGLIIAIWLVVVAVLVLWAWRWVKQLRGG